MQKNVASQKLVVFAFDSTTNLPKTGDAANITAYVSIDYGAVTVLGDTSATEMDATNAKGYYLFDLTQGESNGNTLTFSAKSSTANIVVIGAPAVIQTVPSSFVVAPGSANAIAVAGSNAATTFAGLTTGALACTTITASGAVAFQSTFAVTTSTALAALSCTTLTASGAVAFQSTFAVTTSSAFGAVTCTTLTASGAVALQSTLTITGNVTTTGTTTYTGHVLYSNGIAIAAPSTANRDGFKITGNGTGHGIYAIGGATGNGIVGEGLDGIFGGGTNGMRLFGSNADLLLDSTGLVNDGVTTLTGAVTATSASNDIRGISVLAGGLGVAAPTAAFLNAVADAILDRNMATGTDSGTELIRTVRQALRVLRNKVDTGAGTVYKENDTTASWTFAVTTAAGNPITVVDPT